MTTLNKTLLKSVLAELSAEKAEIEAKIRAIEMLAGVKPQEEKIGGFAERIKEILADHPGSTSHEVKDYLEASGYVRPRAGGQIKPYEVPIALGRLTKAGEVKRVGGDAVHGFEYRVSA